MSTDSYISKLEDEKVEMKLKLIRSRGLRCSSKCSICNGTGGTIINGEAIVCPRIKYKRSRFGASHKNNLLMSVRRLKR